MTVRITQEGVVVSTTPQPLNSKRLVVDIEISSKVRDSTRRWQVKNITAVRVVLMNMIACSKKMQILFYSRQKNKRVTDTYNSRNMNNSDIMDAIDELEQMGMLRNYIADRQFRDEEDKTQSWIVLTSKFVTRFCGIAETVDDAELAYMAANTNIELRNKGDKKRIDYVLDEQLKEADRVVSALNEMNRHHSFVSKDGVPIQNVYTRIFSNGSFLLGGRWYRAQILKMKNKETKDRLRIRIDDEEICEIDMDCLHISILADELGVASKYDTDVYYKILETHQWSVANRTLVKFSVNVCLNATSSQKACMVINKFIKDSPAGTYCFKTGKEVVTAIKVKLPDFKSQFCNKNSTGLRLQNIDSWIAHYVLDSFIVAKQPILVIHDSFICQRKNADMLSKSMSDAYKKVVGVDRVVRMKMNWVEDGVIQVADCSK